MRHLFSKPAGTDSTQGSILVLAIVISTALFGIGTTLASIFSLEAKRQQYGARSRVALNIAHTAFECALYNDFRRGAFRGAHAPADAVVDCGDLYQVRSTTDAGAWGAGPYATSALRGDTFTYAVVATEETDDLATRITTPVPCARVTVKKSAPASIEVLGFDRCLSGNLSSRDLARRFKIYY